MLSSPDDKEICLFSLSLAKNLIQQTIQNLGGDTQEVLDNDFAFIADIPTHATEPDLFLHEKSSPIKLESPILEPDDIDCPMKIESSQSLPAESLYQGKIEHNIEIKGSSSYNRHSMPFEMTTEPGSDRLVVSEHKYEASISQIFDRPGYTESSIFPFSLMGEAPEVLYQRYRKEGVLYKKSSNVFIGWQKRYFEVRGFKIYYSKTQEMLREKKELRCINLFVSPCKISEVKGQTFQITIEGVKKKLNLKAPSITECREWVDFLQELFTFINENQSKASRYVSFKRQKLLKLDVLTEEEFLDRVETGDILLFQSSHFAAKVQRTFTSSKYDHVGLVVKAFDDVYLYDSVCDGGVQLTNWRDFKSLEYHKDYVRIAYRKLDIQDAALKAEIHEKFFKFVTDHTGRKYELSFKKLLKRTSLLPQQGKENKKSDAGEKIPTALQEGFFCSELVAAAYKAVGLLDPVIASSRYYPVSFSHKRPLKLLREANLSNEFGLALTDERVK